MKSTYKYKAYLRNLLWNAGLRRRRRPGRCEQLLAQFDVKVVLDVGANKGQFARHLLRHGYCRRIVSFEPLSSAYGRLKVNAWNIKRWDTVNLALGSYDGTTEINVAGNSQSSSFLNMLPAHVAAAPESAYVATEPVSVRKLDSIIDEHVAPDESCFLKLDVQGFEKQVLMGASNSLDRITGIQLETSLVPLYQGETLFLEMLQLMADRGYNLVSLSDGFCDPVTQRLLQLDAIFYRGGTVTTRRVRPAFEIPADIRSVSQTSFQRGHDGHRQFHKEHQHD